MSPRGGVESAMSQSAQIYISLAILLTLSAGVYLGLRNIAPIAARISLSVGGAIGGSFLGVALLFVLIQPFRDGWNLFGLVFWGVPILFVGGAIGGFLAALRWAAKSTTGRRKLNVALCFTLLLTPVAIFAVPSIVMFAVDDGRPDVMHERSIAIYDFTASLQSVAFVIPTPEDAHSRMLVFIDRATRQAKRIGENQFSYREPHFSQDGERLLFVRELKESRQRDIISCLVQTWQCKVVVQTDNNVHSPIEIEKDAILYSSSPLVAVGDRQHYSKYELYMVKIGDGPIQLTSSPLVTLHSINIAGDKILFGAFGSVMSKPTTSKIDLLAPRSEIFEWTIDRNAVRITGPTEELKPVFFADGYSTNPSASEDGRKVAFHNAELGKATYRFNLMVVDTVTGSRKLIKLEGKDFSRAAFTAGQMLYNELLSDRYRVRAWNPSSDATEEVFEIEFSKLSSLAKIAPSIMEK
jgi:hypothetical protein